MPNLHCSCAVSKHLSERSLRNGAAGHLLGSVSTARHTVLTGDNVYDIFRSLLPIITSRQWFVPIEAVLLSESLLPTRASRGSLRPAHSRQLSILTSTLLTTSSTSSPAPIDSTLCQRAKHRGFGNRVATLQFRHEVDKFNSNCSDIRIGALGDG
jgi:hypothetical protein